MKTRNLWLSGSFVLLTTLITISGNLMTIRAHTNHEHNKIEIPNNSPIPSVELIATPDAIKGWNLQLKLTNFKFAPAAVNKSSKISEGHAHLYINGKKITRLYGTWYYLDQVKKGDKITVTLNTNKHEDLINKRTRIEATVILN